MAINITFWTISKRSNSTALPSGDGTTHACNINQPCSIENPNVVIRNGGDSPAWNYCYIPSFKRYYWVENWLYQDNCWIAECGVDVLGTYRNVIGGYNYYFTRSSVSYDGNIMDNLYPSKATPTVQRENINAGLNPISEYGMSQGYFICGIVGVDGLTNFYAFLPTNFSDFCEKIFTNIDWADISGQQITESLLKCLFNPFQYITSCMWMPVDGVGAGSKSVSEIKFGFWSVEVTALKLGNKPFNTRSFDVPITQHPQVSRGTFLNSPPYRRILLEIEPWGSFELDGAKLGTTESCTATETIDLLSGIGYITVATGNAILYTGYTQVGVNIQISDLRSNVIGSGGGILNSVVSGLTGNWLGALNGIADTVQNAFPPPTTKGVNGSLLSISAIPRIMHVFYRIVDEDLSDNGRPCMKNGTMDGLGEGFYIVENGSTPISGATMSEMDELKRILESGVYYA